MDVHERVRTLIEPVLTPLGIEVVDVELVGSGRARTLRVSIDREGGVDLETITEATRAVSPALDDDDPVPGRYTLEVSSPGVERPLRRPRDFERMTGEKVAVKTHTEVAGARRHQGVLDAVGDDGFDLVVDGDARHIRFEEVASARTVFEWGPAPKPGGRRRDRDAADATSHRTDEKEQVR